MLFIDKKINIPVVQLSHGAAGHLWKDPCMHISQAHIFCLDNCLIAHVGMQMLHYNLNTLI